MSFGPYRPSSPARQLSNVLALVALAWVAVEFAAWLGLAAPFNCQLGRLLHAIVETRLIEALTMVCFVAWCLSLFRWHVALIVSLLLLAALSVANGQAPTLLSAC